MSNPSPDSQVFRGSVYFDDGWELRVTDRCLVEDAASSLGACLNELADVPLRRTLVRFGDTRPSEVGTVLFTDGDCRVRAYEGDGCVLALWHDQGEEIVWALACEPDEAIEVTVEAAHRAGTLWPTELDRWRAEGDRLASWIHDVRLIAPLLLKRASERPGPASVPFGRRRSLLTLEIAPDGTIFAALLDAAPLSHAERLRTLAIVAASIKADAGWEPAERLPGRHTADKELVLRLSG